MWLADELCDAKSMIDRQKVLSLCPSWGKPMADGIPCIVFRRELEEACPDLPGFLSQAGNQSHDVHAKETKLQLMISLHQLFVAERNMATATESAGSAPADAKEVWNKVKKAMLGMKPHFSSSMDAAAKFVATWCAADIDANLKNQRKQESASKRAQAR